ncbi:hypothetical protein [Rugamonas apoptosis]|uniref:Uncharacterized protein n=1 Tax=Rugamonas apoptosis TaxID=2758570 RepID=A0A7W2ILT4_9BURK|nr:hypothetical protein [Rugamonas apoptosis]MBA5689145.1 hypothetical protein [Rugamonas apoptosis]
MKEQCFLPIDVKENMDKLFAAEVIVPFLAGGLVTWFFSWLYYARAGRELQQEAGELRRLNGVLLRGLENAGLMKVARDDQGNATGLIIEAEVTARAKATMTTNVE